MHSKNNRLTYRRDEAEQKMYETSSVPPLHINKITESTEPLKRAYTIVPAKNNDIAPFELNIEQAPSVQHPFNMAELNEKQDESWPSLEELEALIRGDLPQQDSSKEENEPIIYPPSSHKTQASIDKPDVKKSPIQVIETTILEEATPYEREQLHRQVTYIAEATTSTPIYEDKVFPQADELQLTRTYESSSWTKLLTAVASSIVTGVLIGYVLLLAVYGANVWPVNIISKQLTDTSEPVSVAEPIAPQPTLSDQPVTPDPSLASSGDVSTTVVPQEKVVIEPMQTFTYTALQAGVFTKEDTKQALIDTLQARGYPAVTMKAEDGKMVVFAGIASSQQATYQTNHMSGVELYRKTFSVHIPQLSTNEQLEVQLQQWMFNVQDLMKSYMLMSEAQFEQTSFSAIYADSYKLLEEKYNSLVNETKQLESKLEDEPIKSYVAFHRDKLDAVHQGFAQYQQKPSAAPLFDIQEELLTLITYQAEQSLN